MHFKQIIALNIFIVTVFGVWVSLSHYYNQYPSETQLTGKYRQRPTTQYLTEEEEEEPMLVNLHDISFMDTHRVDV